MRSKRPHEKVLPTNANLQQDARNKMKLSAEFENFKNRLVKAANTSPEVRELVVPLEKLELAVRIGAHGKLFLSCDTKKKT